MPIITFAVMLVGLCLAAGGEFALAVYFAARAVPVIVAAAVLMFFGLFTAVYRTLAVGNAVAGMPIIIFAVVFMFFGLVASSYRTLAVPLAARMPIVVFAMVGVPGGLGAAVYRALAVSYAVAGMPVVSLVSMMVAASYVAACAVAGRGLFIGRIRRRDSGIMPSAVAAAVSMCQDRCWRLRKGQGRDEDENSFPKFHSRPPVFISKNTCYIAIIQWVGSYFKRDSRKAAGAMAESGTLGEDAWSCLVDFLKTYCLLDAELAD